LCRGGERGEGRGLRLHSKNEEKKMTNNEVAHRGRRPSLEPRKKPSIDGDSEVRSTNRMHYDEALDKTNATVSLDSTDDAWIESNCSPKLDPLRTSASNSGS
jgi:hypothetical protein